MYTKARDWYEYRLTTKGLDLFPVAHALMAWGDAYEAPNGVPVMFGHSCGQTAGHKVVCVHYGDDVARGNVRFTASLGLVVS